MAAYYYPWYGPGGLSWNLGYARGQLEPAQGPLLGEYSSRDDAVVAQHFAWAHEYGVDVFLCSWSGPGSYSDGTIRDHVLPSPARGPTQIGLMYESLQRLGIGDDARIHLDESSLATLRDDFTAMARTYFDDPGYYRIDGRPVVVLYASRIYRGPVAEAIATIREAVSQAVGVDPYLIGDEVDWDDPPNAARIRLYDAITGYTPYSRTQVSGWPATTGWLDASERRVSRFRAIARRHRVGFVPDALAGFDDRGYRPAEDHHVLPRQLDPTADPASLFESSLQLAGGQVDPRLGLLAVTSWNEWYEDSQIEPTAPADPTASPEAVSGGYPFTSYGTSLLDLLARFKEAWQRVLRDGRATAS